MTDEAWLSPQNLIGIGALIVSLVAIIVSAVLSDLARRDAAKDRRRERGEDAAIALAQLAGELEDENRVERGAYLLTPELRREFRRRITRTALVLDEPMRQRVDEIAYLVGSWDDDQVEQIEVATHEVVSLAVTSLVAVAGSYARGEEPPLSPMLSQRVTECRNVDRWVWEELDQAHREDAERRARERDAKASSAPSTGTE